MLYIDFSLEEPLCFGKSCAVRLVLERDYTKVIGKVTNYICDLQNMEQISKQQWLQPHSEGLT